MVEIIQVLAVMVQDMAQVAVVLAVALVLAVLEPKA
jgi:hypothetical protein